MNPETTPTSRATDPPVPDQADTRVSDKVFPAAKLDEPAVGMQVGEFVLLEELGRGAFGRVYLAGQEAFNRKVALKVTRQRAMSTDEGRALGVLEHDHIVKVYSA